jgi:uncharacterized protein
VANGFAPGTHVLMRHVWRDEVFLAAPVTVVQDEPDLLVTWLAPGTTYMRPEVRRQLPFGQRLVDRPWKPPGVVQLTRPGDAHSVWVFANAWYVNLQEPIRRTELGFDTCDQLLDLVRYRDGQWRWKDEDELAAAVEQGFVSPADAAAVRAEAERVVAADPFPTGWERWAPDPAWPVPALPDGWDRLP